MPWSRKRRPAIAPCPPTCIAQGGTAVAAQFETLATAENRHVADVAARSRALVGHPPDPDRIRWNFSADYGEQAARGAVLSANQALAFAMRNEERAFAFTPTLPLHLPCRRNRSPTSMRWPKT